MAKVRLAALDEVPDGGNRAFAVGERSVLVCRSSVGVFAVENMCSHAYALLEGGRVKGPHLFCPLHGVRFDLRTGEPNGQLTKRPLTCYKVELVDGQVEVELP